ncbi:protein ROLLING AND ERECT LEAF 2-like isoform X2 [Primulina tabacum]|uniref:protein ROLLING AND ERECT LEAF 2-like isoform X2 n=1 Tax=Primulina tabacum TaxID=48773 RepID=UPI003F5AD68B
MGCAESKIENEEAVLRCRDRKQFMKQAVIARNKFAAAHSAHAMSLKNSGASLSDFAHGEVVFPSSAAVDPSAASSSGASATPHPIPYDNFLVPPPPLPPSFSTAAPLQRASTMPEFSIPLPVNKHSDPIIEEVNDEEDDKESESSHSLRQRSSKSGRRGVLSSPEVIAGEVMHQPLEHEGHEQQQQQPIPPPVNKGMSRWDYFFSMEHVPGPTLAEVEENHVAQEEIERKMVNESAKRSEMDRGKKGETVDVMEKVSEFPPHLPPPEEALTTTKVVKKGKQVVVLPPGKKNSGGSNLNLVQIFADMDDCFLKASESAHEVSRMLEATRLHYHSNFADKRGHINHSERVMRVITWNRSFKGLPNENDGTEDFDSEEQETHATVLDKMLAWEKKLYDEVKAGEQMKLEYQKKVKRLNKLKQHGSNLEALERMKAAVSHLHTRYIVDMQSMDSTVSEINRLRDEQLYPKLVALVDGMAAMWETMRSQHERKSEIVQALRLLGDSQSPKETSDHHFERTHELVGVIREWHSNIDELMTQQREYIKAINSWLNLNLIPIDTNLNEKVSSPGRYQNPPILKLVQTWNGYLDKSHDQAAKAAIMNFAATMETIWLYQKDEMDFRKRCADSRKDLVRKKQDFENWYNKYMQKRTPPDEMDPDRTQDKDLYAERKLIVESAEHKLENEEEAYLKHCVQVRQKSLNSLKSQLPALFQALSDFSLACSDMYDNLRSIAQRQNRNEA